ncbi:hypothetical protein GCM10018781_56770 [Kitasatospora indigofera]|uniref:Uncharacterized protein n=1 Tax=Kitasatospora indigofera TaxID=67307 RepID=A0A919L1E4_9ACTN|nr:hypothetical protein [Kitasatospora indigofera]GHH79226.1 hypothetical protein GCM10018781_56770 [Kitasatospora indigofera]
MRCPPEDAALVRDFVEIPPGLAIDRTYLERARLAQAVGGRFRKVAPGRYEIITHAPDSPAA